MVKSKKKGINIFVLMLLLVSIAAITGTLFLSVNVSDDLLSPVVCSMPYTEDGENKCEFYLTLDKGEQLSEYSLVLDSELVLGDVKSADLTAFAQKSFLEIDHNSRGDRDLDTENIHLYRLPNDENMYDFSLKCSATTNIGERDGSGNADGLIISSFEEDYPYDDMIVCDYGDNIVSRDYRSANPCQDDWIVRLYNYADNGYTSEAVSNKFDNLAYSIVSTSSYRTKIKDTITATTPYYSLDDKDKDNLVLIGESIVRLDEDVGYGSITQPTCSVNYHIFQKPEVVQVFIGSDLVQTIDLSYGEFSTKDLSSEINSYCGRDLLSDVECNVPLRFVSDYSGDIILKNQSSSVSVASATSACVGCDGSEYSFKGINCPVNNCKVTCYSCDEGVVNEFVSSSFICPSSSSKAAPAYCGVESVEEISDLSQVFEDYSERDNNLINYLFAVAIILLIFVIYRGVRNKQKR